jgi:hypothetical protein
MAATLPPGFYAVIMGDLVDSEIAQSVEMLHARFNAEIELCNAAFKRRLVSPLTITLGDEFQGLAKSLGDALDIVRTMRLDMLGAEIDCRFAVGAVDIKTRVNTDRAWNMMGRGLARTRERLNEKKAGTRYRFALEDHPAVEVTTEALGASLTAIEERWTEQQLEDIAATMAGMSAKEIAERRNVSVHSVYKVRNSGELDLYLFQWGAIAEALSYLDQAYREAPCQPASI